MSIFASRRWSFVGAASSSLNISCAVAVCAGVGTVDSGLTATDVTVAAGASAMNIVTAAAALGYGANWLTGWFVYPGLLFCGACVLSKRLHDRGRSGWWAAVILIALAAVWPYPIGFFDFLFALVVIWAVVELGVMGGEQGANRFGPNPNRTTAAV